MIDFNDHMNGLIRPHATGEAIHPSSQRVMPQPDKEALPVEQATYARSDSQPEQLMLVALRGINYQYKDPNGAFTSLFERKAER